MTGCKQWEPLADLQQCINAQKLNFYPKVRPETMFAEIIVDMCSVHIILLNYCGIV